jgi:hypothetical protein
VYLTLVWILKTAISDVEELRAELQSQPLRHLVLMEQRNVEILQGLRAKNIAAGGSERILRRRDEGVLVEPLAGAGIRLMRIGNQTRTVRLEASGAPTLAISRLVTGVKGATRCPRSNHALPCPNSSA